MKEGIAAAYAPRNNVHRNQQLRGEPKTGRQMSVMNIAAYMVREQKKNGTGIDYLEWKVIH